MRKDSPSIPRGFWILLGLLLFFAILLRVVQLGHVPGVNGDEAFWEFQTSRLLRGESFLARSLTGNPLNPFFVLPAAFLTAVFSPSFAWLRVPALGAHLLLLAFCYPMVRARWGATAGFLALVGFAACPTLIGYSRFGWDPSQSVPACFLALCLAHDRRAWATVLAFVAAFLIHPTNVFLAPVLAALLFRSGIPDSLRPSHDRSHSRKTQLSWILFLGLGALVFAFRSRILAPAASFGGTQELLEAAARITDLTLMQQFMQGIVELLNGVTFFRYVAGPVSEGWTTGSNWGLGLPLLLALVFGARAALKHRDTSLIALMGGLALALWLFYLRTGTLGVTAHTERYAQWMISPFILCLSVGAARVLTRAWLHKATLGFALSLGALGLYSTLENYFGVFWSTGGLSHVTFQTGKTEPKDSAWRLIQSLAPDTGPVQIQVEDYWPVYPIAYLAWREPRFRVQLDDGSLDSTSSTTQFWLAYAGGARDLQLAQAARTNPRLERREISGWGNRPVFALYRFFEPSRALRSNSSGVSE
jgi:hypothetical protein